MLPKRPLSFEASGSERKRQRKMLTIADKVKLLDMLKEVRNFAAVGRHFGINESTVRYIKKEEANISKTATLTLNKTAKRVVTRRNKNVMRMESALALWIADCREKNIILTTSTIQAKAKNLYETFAANETDNDSGNRGEVNEEKEDPQPGMFSNSPPRKQSFVASKGWFAKFQKRFGLKSLLVRGGAGSADTAAAEDYLNNDVKKIIEEGGYAPEQVFDMDETGIFSKTCFNDGELKSQETVYIKSEVPDSELEFVSIKEEPTDLHQEPSENSLDAEVPSSPSFSPAASVPGVLPSAPASASPSAELLNSSRCSTATPDAASKPTSKIKELSVHDVIKMAVSQIASISAMEINEYSAFGEVVANELSKMETVWTRRGHTVGSKEEFSGGQIDFQLDLSGNLFFILFYSNSTLNFQEEKDHCVFGSMRHLGLVLSYFSLSFTVFPTGSSNPEHMSPLQLNFGRRVWVSVACFLCGAGYLNQQELRNTNNNNNRFKSLWLIKLIVSGPALLTSVVETY
ncbi:HTH CenpB-type DNA-binding domain [Trinorchestia longiramus]|nr:HTH CenpB-type DNA-binding domain [Trinorchestia longiramus]